MKALVILSGGQDSTTCLYWAIKKYQSVQAIFFDYGQRHINELKYAKQTAVKNKIPLKIINLSLLHNLSNSALIDDSKDVSDKNAKGLPSSYVPNRNQLFLVVAHAWAQKINAGVLVTGVSSIDYSGYPDCRPEFISAIQHSMNLGSEENIKIKTPLINKSKAETFQMAEDLGVLEEIINNTLTCYHGQENRHDFGRGCGICPACVIRKKGFENFRAS